MASDDAGRRLGLVSHDHVDTERPAGTGQFAREHVGRSRNVPDNSAEPQKTVHASHAPQHAGQMADRMGRRPEGDEVMSSHQRLHIRLMQERGPMPAPDKLVREGEHGVEVPEERRGDEGEVGQGSRSLRAKNLENCRTRGYALTITLP
jgi:hypothetical protein